LGIIGICARLQVGGVVGDDRHLGRAGLAVGTDHAAEHALGRGHVDVARAGDDVGRRAVFRAVGEHGQRLRTADRVHLGHAEQRARGEHGRMRQAAVAYLRRGRHRDRGHARGLGRDDVHHDRGGIGHQPAGDVHPGPADRHDRNACFDREVGKALVKRNELAFGRPVLAFREDRDGAADLEAAFDVLVEAPIAVTVPHHWHVAAAVANDEPLELARHEQRRVGEESLRYLYSKLAIRTA